jgi:hypothetical protein
MNLTTPTHNRCDDFRSQAQLSHLPAVTSSRPPDHLLGCSRQLQSDQAQGTFNRIGNLFALCRREKLRLDRRAPILENSKVNV